MARSFINAGDCLTSTQESGHQNDWSTQMVTADSKCPQCGNGIMKLFPETKPLIPEPEQSELRARCTACNYEDTVTIPSDD